MCKAQRAAGIEGEHTRYAIVSFLSMTSQRGVVALTPALLAATVLVLISGQELVAREFTVEITGTEGAAFGGTCLLITGKNSTSYVASGLVPLRLEFSGDIISCAIQRKTESAYLQIVIKDSNGSIVAASTEMFPFGVVMTSGR